MNLLDNFKNYLFSQEVKPSRVTVKNYSSDINHFVKWFEKQYGAFLSSPITNTVLDQYKAEFAKSFSPASMQRHLSSLRKFFKYLKSEGKMTMDPFLQSTIHTNENKDLWKLKDFKNNLFVGNAAHLTIKNYIIDIKQFIAWAKEVTGIEDDLLINRLDKEFVEEYKQRLVKDEAFSPATVNRKLSSLRKYLTWAQNEGLLTQNLTSIENINEAKQKLYIPSASSLDQVQLGKEGNIKEYSKFPPLRLMQKFSLLGILGFDKLFTAPLVKIATKTQEMVWKLKGQPIFEKGPQTLVTKNITAHDLLGIKNISKQLYAPFKLSIDNYSPLQKLIFHARYTRPNWYKRYHSYAITHYFHFAILVIFLAAVGFGIYNSFFTKPSNQNPALAALPTAPPRILSFQGRLTDNNDNPITSNTNIRFAIYNNLTASGAALLWQEVDPVTPDVDGIFNAILGNISAIPSTLFSENAALYLGVTIEATPELTPRQQLATVAYAANSETLQGLPPSTAVGAATSNVVLALDSSGNLTIGGSANPSFSATGGQFKLSGQPLLLTTNTGTDANVQITTDDLGKIDLQKPILNSTNSNNITTAIGAVEVNDLFAVLATSSGQSAVTINQTSTGPIISASTGGTAKFTIDNSGNEEIAGNLTAAGTTGISLSGNGAGITFSGTGNHDITASAGTLRLGALTLTGAVTGNSQSLTGLNNLSAAGTVTFSNFNANNNVLYATVTTGVLAGANTSTTGLCLVSGATAPIWTSCSTASSNYWQLNNGTLSPFSNNADVLFGNTATISAAFAFTGLSSLTNQTQASISGQLIVMPNNGYSGKVGIGTTSPGVKLSVVKGGAVYDTAPTLGSGTVGVFSLLSGNGLYGLYSGISGNGDTWLQSQRNDTSTSTYNILLNPSGGNVGIRTIAPTTTLDITGSASISANLGFRGAATAHTLNIFDNGTLNIQRSPGGDAGLATALFIQNNGNVGIGTTTPTAPLYILKSLALTGESQYGIVNSNTYTGEITASKSTFGNYNAITVSGNDGPFSHTLYSNYNIGQLSDGNSIDTMYGVYSQIQSNSTLISPAGNTATTSAAFNGAALNNASGTITTQYGGLFSSYNNSTGTVTAAYGTYNQAYNNNATGTVTSAYGARNRAFTNVANAAITTAYGTYSDIATASGTTTGGINTAYGVYSGITSPINTTAYGVYSNVTGVTTGTNYGIYVNTTGSVTNNYGVRVTGTTAAGGNYGLYVDAAAQNYFAGNVGIGDTGPDAKLEVLGTTEQLRLTYTDGTVDSRFTVGSGGDLTIDASTDGTGSETLTLTGFSTLTASSLTTLSLGTSATINAGATALNLQADGTPDVNIAGGSGTTGCTIANATGNLTCSGTISGSGATGYWNRTVGNIYPATTNDTISATTSASVALTLTQTGAFNALLVEDSASDTTPFVIDQSGNVGIGNTSPTNAKLLVGGTLDRSAGGSAAITSGLQVTTALTPENNGSAPGRSIYGIYANLGTMTGISGAANNTFADIAITPATVSLPGGGTLTNHIGLYIDAAPAGATNNYAAIFAGGNVGIGDAGPDAFLEVLGTTEQLRLTHTDGTIDARLTLDASGNLTVDASTDGTGSETLTLTGFSTLTASSLTTLSLGTSATINAGATALNLQADGTPDVNIAGGSGTTGCTIANATGNLTCSGTISGSGATGYWNRNVGNIFPATANDTISATTSAAVALTLTQTGAFNSLLVQDEASDTTPFVIDQSGNVGIGDTTPDAFLEVLGTTEQLRLTYTDGAVDSRFTVDASGNLNIDNTGTKTTIADDLQVTGNDILDSGAATRITLGATTTLTNTTTTLSGTSTLTASSLATVTSAASLGVSATTLTLGNGSAATLATTTNGLTLDSGSNTLTIAASDTTLTASGITTVSLGTSATINAGATALNLQADGTPDVNIAGGSGTTGCTVANATGNLTCSGTITGTGATGYWTRLAGNLSPATLNDTISATSAASTVATFTTSNPAATLTNNTLINQTGAGTVTNLLNLTQTGGAATNALTFSGTFTKLINSTNFNVTNAGAVTAVGVDSGTGLIQGTGGITTTGATSSINASSNFATNIGTGTSNALVTIGGGSGTAAVSTTSWAVTSAGVGSGFTGFASTGTIAFSGAGAFSVDSSAFDVTSGGAVSGVTTLTSSGSTTIGTGASTNTVGAGASSVNTIGSVTTPGALTLHGATTLDNTFTVSGANLTSLGGNLTVTGTAWTATPTISGLITGTSGVSIGASQSYTGAGAVTLSSGGGLGLTLDSASNTLTVAATDTILTASGLATVTLGTSATINAGATALNLQADGTPDVNIAGGSGTTGCTIANSTGNLTCSGVISGTIDTALTQGSVVFAGATGGLSEDNANFFFDDTANNLGIRTTSIPTESGLALGYISTTEGGQLQLNPGSSGSTAWFLDVLSNNFRIMSGTTAGSNATRLRIDNSWKLGIGTENDTVDSQLEVTRPLSFGVTGKALVTFDQIENQDIFTASDSGTTRFVIQKDGDVGINTNLPGYNLEIENTADSAIFLEADTDNATETDNPFIKLSQDNTAVQSIFGLTGATGVDPENNAYTGTLENSILLGGLTALENLQFGTNDNVRMTIETTGDVGIGDTSPASLFTVGDGDDFQVDSTGNISTNATGTALTLSGAATTGILISGGATTAINISSATTTTDINLQNGETIDNNTDGVIKLTGMGYITNDFAIASASGVPAPYNNTNITPNPSFEVLSGGTIADGWTSGGTVSRLSDGTANHDGAYGMSLSAAAATTANIVTNRQPVTPSTTYTISAWAKVDTACGDGFYLRAFWNDEWGNSAGTSDAYGNSGAVTTSWALFTGQVTSPANAYNVRMQIYNNLPNNTCTLYIDQVSFRPMIDGDVLVNGDVLIGGTSETIAAAGFTLANTELFVAGAAGVEGTIYTDTGFDVASTVLGVSSLVFTGAGQINTSDWDIDASGNMSGIGTIAANGLVTLSAGGTDIEFTGATSNRIDWNTTGVAAPTFTSYSAGVKAILYDSIGASSVGYTIGIESSTMFFTAGTTADQFKWYSGTTNNMTLSGAGALTVVGAITEQGSAVLSAANIDTCSEFILLVDSIGTCGSTVFSVSPTLTGTLTAAIANFSGAVDLASTLNVDGTISGNSKTMFVTTDTYLRINQTMASQFTTGVWFGTSHILGSTGYFAMGSNGGTTTSDVWIKGTYDGTNDISLDGDTGNITASGDITEGGSAVLSVVDLDTCSEFAALGALEIGTCGSVVLSVSPTLTGTLTAAAITATGTITLTGDFNLTEPTGTTMNVLGTKPASVGTTPGTAAAEILDITGPAGGDTTIATTGVGGIGSGISWTMGAGGIAGSATTSSTGGAGGAISFTSGTGGAAAETGTDIGGAGGAISLVGGTGGAATVGSSLTGGAGGGITITAGAAGAGGNANGGTLTLNSGAVTGSGTSTINLGSASVTTLNLGTVANTKTINLGTGTGVDTINIGTGATGVDVITIGSSVTSLALNDTQWSITTAGVASFVGVDANAGLLQGALGLTITGAAVSLNAGSNFATNINTGTSTGTITLGGTGAQTIAIGNGVAAKTITIGNGSDDTFSIASSGLDLTSAGAVSGVTTLAMGGALTGVTTITTSGAINSQTISSAANFTGTVAITTSLNVPQIDITTWSIDQGGLCSGTNRLCFEYSAASQISFTTGGQGRFTNGAVTDTPDFAENISVLDQTIESGDIVTSVIYDSTEENVYRKSIASKSNKSYEGSIIGAISENPGFLAAQGNAMTLGDRSWDDDERPLTIAGRIPVKISTINGKIKTGDPITSSEIPGIGMKATRPGVTLGIAMADYEDDKATQSSKLVNGQWQIQNNICQANEDDCYNFEKILVFINPSWRDPDVYLTSTGNLNIADNTPNLNFNTPHLFALNDPFGIPIERIGVFSEIIVAKVKAGFIEAQQISTNSLAIATDNVSIAGQSLYSYISAIVSEQLENVSNFNSNNITSPIASIDTIKTGFISPLGGEDSSIGIKVSKDKIEIVNTDSATNSAVASFDDKGNATLSGTLTSAGLSSDNASISGTLRARRIIADQIEGLDIKAATIAANYITNVTNVYNSSSSAFPTLGASESGQVQYAFDNGSYINIATFSSQLAYVENLSSVNGVFSQNLTAFGTTTLSDTSIVGQLAVGGSLILANNSINVLGNDLNLQPLRQGGISIMAGLIYIDTSGNVKIGNDATIEGTLYANQISPISGKDLTFKLSSNSATTNNIVVKGASNSAVLAIDNLGNLIASGAGNFAKLNLNNIVGPALAVSPTEMTATGSAGTAQINSNRVEMTINNKLVTEKSLIYITPTSNTQNQVLYLIRQVPNESFTVGIQSQTTADIPFNWIIIN